MYTTTTVLYWEKKNVLNSIYSSTIFFFFSKIYTLRYICIALYNCVHLVGYNIIGMDKNNQIILRATTGFWLAHANHFFSLVNFPFIIFFFFSDRTLLMNADYYSKILNTPTKPEYFSGYYILWIDLIRLTPLAKFPVRTINTHAFDAIVRLYWIMSKKKKRVDARAIMCSIYTHILSI